MAAERQIIERGEDKDPVLRAAGRGQAVGEQLRRAVVISLAEPDLAKEVIHHAGEQQVLDARVPSEVVIAGDLT